MNDFFSQFRSLGSVEFTIYKLPQKGNKPAKMKYLLAGPCVVLESCRSAEPVVDATAGSAAVVVFVVAAGAAGFVVSVVVGEVVANVVVVAYAVQEPAAGQLELHSAF